MAAGVAGSARAAGGACTGEVLDFDIRSVDRDEVLRYLGHAGQELGADLEARVDADVARCIEVSRPAGVVRVFECAEATEEDGRFVQRLEGTALELPGESMRAYLAGARAVGVFAVTLGMANERELRRLSLTSRVDELILDAASSALVERAADAAEARVVREATDRGLYTNYRFSPGYGDLPMSVQPTLLATLDAQRRLGIALSSTRLMTPTKSVTALVGLYGSPQGQTRLSCKGCICHDFCLLRPTGRTCYGKRH